MKELNGILNDVGKKLNNVAHEAILQLGTKTLQHMEFETQLAMHIKLFIYYIYIMPLHFQSLCVHISEVYESIDPKRR